MRPFQANVKHEILLETSSLLSETVPTGQVSQIFDQPVETQNININVIPFSAIAEEQTLVEEKEQQYSKTVPVEFVAKRSLDTNEAYQVRENIPETSPSTFESTFQPTLSTATKNVTSAEGIVITEVHENQSTSHIDSEKLLKDIASVNYILQEATSVAQTEAIIHEDELKEKILPKSSTATESYKMSEGIYIEENQDLSSTTTLNIEKVTPVTSKVNIDAIEPLVIQEVYTDSKPGKHLPEAFVPTEIANTKFISQKQIITSETVASEIEGEFVPGRLPPSQTAAINLTIAEGLLNEQIQTDDKESTFEVSHPETTTASSELTLSASITVSTTDSQMPSQELIVETTQEQKAEVAILSKQSLTTTTVVLNESDKDYVPSEMPQSRIANTGITCLEIGSVSNVTVQESEQDLIPDIKPSMGIAEKNVKHNVPLQVSEISTADVPGDFTQYPKYNTQTAIIDFEMQDATQITEIRTEETEEKYEGTTVQSFVPSSTTTESQQELSVTEVKTMESETELPVFELPSSHKGKETPAHIFPTSTKEIITPQISAADLSVETPESKTVNITQTTLAETMISETVAADSLGAYTDVQQVKTKQADVSVTITEGVTVTEILTDEKEKVCIPSDLPKQYQADIGVDSRKAANIMEILTNFLPDSLVTDTPLLGQAKPQEIVAEGIQVLQHQTAEKENQYESDILPETKYPTYELEVGHSELSITETYVQESESGYTEKEKPKEVLATENFTTQEVAVKTQNEMICHTDQIEQEEPITGRAKKYARPLQELIITEATAAEFHKELPRDIFPYEKKVHVNLIPGQQLTVTEVTANDLEEDFTSVPEPSQKHATTTVTTKEVAVNEETLSHIEPDVLKPESPIVDTATTQQDVAYHLTQLQLTAAEKESVYLGDIKPESKTINIGFEEEKSITVIEVQTQDTENELNVVDVPSLAQGKAEFAPCNVAVKEEITSDHSVINIDSPKPKMSEAQIKHMLLEGLIHTETKAEENESSFKEVLPEAGTATDNILLEDTVTVSSTVVPADKEDVLEVVQLPSFSHATFDIPEQRNVETTEVQASDNFATLNDLITQEAFAKTSHIEHHSITQSEMTVGESEEILPKDAVPDKKTAGLSIDSVDAAVTEEILTEEKENVLLETDKPITKFADKLIDAQPVAETTETTLENIVEVMTTEDHDTKTANITQSTFESISQSTVTLAETETVFEKTEIAVKQADVAFNEDKSVDILEITPADREEEYLSDDRTTTQTAFTQIDTIEAVQGQEIPVHEDITDLTLKQPKSTFAETDIQTFNAAIASENILHESETKLEEKIKADVKKADITIPASHSVGITTSIETAIKETTFVKSELPEGKQATTEITDLNSVATNFEILSDTRVTEFNDKPLDAVNANMKNIPYEAITEIQPIVVETEGDVPESRKPDTYSVSIGVEPWKSIEISEVTLADANEDYKPPAHIDQKLANIEVNSELQVTQIEAVLISETTSDFQAKVPEELIADQTSSLLSSILISENIVCETGKESLGKFTAPTSHVDIALEPGKPVQNISEVVTQEKESELITGQVNAKQSALVSIDTHKVAETEQIAPQTATDEFTEKSPIQNVANIKTIELEYLTEQQPEVCEREGNADITLKTTPKTAEISLDELSPIKVSEINSTENEILLQDFEIPKSVQADKEYLGAIAVEASEIYQTYSLTDITKEENKEYIAKEQQDFFEGVMNIETVLADSEKNEETQFMPESKRADISISEFSGISVQETYSQDQQQEHTVSKLDSQHITETYSPLQSLQTTDIVASENTSQLLVKEAASTVVNIQQTTLDSIISLENIIHEKESNFESEKATDTKTANTTMLELQSIDTTEIFVQEMEDMYQVNKQSESQLAVLNILPQESLQQYEVEVQSTANELEIPKLFTDEAIPTQSYLDSVEVSENLLHEQEIKLESKQPDAKLANVAFLPQKYVTISEAVTESKEIKLEKEQKSEAVADQSFLPQSAVEVLEPMGLQTSSSFSQETPVEVQSTASTLPLETVAVTDLILGEKENVFLQQTSPKAENATTDVSAGGLIASTSEVATELKEALIPSFQARPENATVAVLKQTPIEETEVNTSYNIEKLPLNEKTELRKAISRQATFESIIQSEVNVQEKARYIDTEYEDSKSATVSITTNEGIHITEVHIEEKEADKVITGKASEKLSQTEIQGHTVAITEEIMTLQSSDTIDLNKLRDYEVQAKHIQPAIQYGLVISEQRSTGELESVPYPQKPQSKKGRVLYEGATTTPIISEIHPEEKEGKYFNYYLNGR